MITASEIKPGRIYTLEFSDSECKVKKYLAPKGQEREHNPLAGCAVSVKRQIRVRAAGKKTWENWNKKNNPDWEASADWVAWWTPFYTAEELAKPESKRNSAIVEHKKEATRYLRGLPLGVNWEVYTIDGKPATPEQVATIKKFSDKGGNFLMLTLDKLNLIDDTDDQDTLIENLE